MRILIVSDIHANWPALESIREPFDVCLFLGDAVDYGPDPGPCIDWVREHCRHAVRGNHDHALVQRVRIEGAGGFRYLTGATRALTESRVGPSQRRYLADLPVTDLVTLGSRRFLLVHATPRDPLDEYGKPDPEFWAGRLEGVPAEYVLVGHTHQPYCLKVGERWVINPGSVGLPRDGDPRASYALFDGSQLSLRRAEYPVEETVRAVRAAPLPPRAKEMLESVYRTGRLPAPAAPRPVPAHREAAL